MHGVTSVVILCTVAAVSIWMWWCNVENFQHAPVKYTAYPQIPKISLFLPLTFLLTSSSPTKWRRRTFMLISPHPVC